MSEKFDWWQTAIIYQIHPHSFQDSIGNLRGIRQRLDDLRRLNVTALWLSPLYPSLLCRFGDDMTGPAALHPLFGTFADFDALLAEVHLRGMKLILDLVPNHTSTEHPWFQESRSSRTAPRRNWYLWHDPATDGGPPNHWTNFLGGPAWTFDAETGQYYLHQFTAQQPELNYRHPAVLEAILGEMRFWLERGVDGFCVDVIWLLLEDVPPHNEPVDPNWHSINPPSSLQHISMHDQPEMHDMIRRMRLLLDEYDDRMMLGEIHLPNEKVVTYYGAEMDECHLPFNFQLIHTEWKASAVRARVDAYEAMLPPGGWPSWVLGNHARTRLATRVGTAQGRVATLLLLTLRGTPTCYYGDELSIEDVPILSERMQDPPIADQPSIAGRDSTRTPMHWDASAAAGFTTPDAQRRLPLPSDDAQRHTAVQSTDPRSMLNFFRALTALRQSSPALTAGTYAAVDTSIENLFAYTRTHGTERLLIVLNFAGSTHRIDLSALGKEAEIVLSTGMESTGKLRLRALYVVGNEGMVLRL